MTARAKGQITVGEDVGDGHLVLTAECRDVCHMDAYYGDGKENAAYLAAAWNACAAAGLSREALEQGAVKELVEACKALASKDCQYHGEIPWKHNAAITKDIEALREIALAFSSVWNKKVLPALQKTGL